MKGKWIIESVCQLALCLNQFCFCIIFCRLGNWVRLTIEKMRVKNVFVRRLMIISDTLNRPLFIYFKHNRMWHIIHKILLSSFYPFSFLESSFWVYVLKSTIKCAMYVYYTNTLYTPNKSPSYPSRCYLLELSNM